MEHKKAYQLHMSPLAPEEAMVQGPCYRFTVLTPRLIRMEYQENGHFTDMATQVVLNRAFPVPEYQVKESETGLEILTGALHLHYDKGLFSSLSIRLLGQEGAEPWHYGDAIDDLRGTYRTLDQADGPVALEPGLLSRGGYTLLDDSHSALMLPDGWVAEREEASQDLYFFGYGHDYLGCLEDFFRLTGETPLLPRFALGNWWSRFYPYTEESYLALMERFRREKIPFSVAVLDMDWHITQVPEQYGSGWTGYTWNRQLFPDPARFLHALHEQGLHVTLNVHPAGGVRAFEEAYLPMAKALGADWQHQEPIPFNAADRRFMEAYFQYLHHPNEELGVDFWWIDWQQGSASGLKNVDTLWLLNHLHFLDSGRDGRQPLTFSRYAGIGSHRYPIGFSGDSVTSWKTLDFQPYFTANASNVGYCWWSHDIGGHMLGSRDDELCTRWVQFGVFSPIMRLHSTSSPFYGKEPWNFNPQAERTMVRFLQLRHRMIPYLYTMNYRTHAQGRPLIQPMYYRHDREEAYGVPNEYYFGDLIACPITQKANPTTLMASVRVWIPEGEYCDIFTGQRYSGNKEITMFRPLESFPVLAHAGTILPLDADPMNSHRTYPKCLDIVVFHGADGVFTLYEDGSQTQMEYTLLLEQGCVRFSTKQLGDVSILPAGRQYTLHIRGLQSVTQAEAQGCRILSDAYDGCDYCLTLADLEQEATVTLHADTLAAAEPDIGDRIFQILNRAQIEFAMKDKIYAMIQQPLSRQEKLAKLQEMPILEGLRGAIAEQLLALC